MNPTDGCLAGVQRLAPLSWFDEEQLSRALPAIQRRRYPARTLIQRAGSASDGLYILLAGRVHVLHHDSDGHEFIAAIVRVHDFFGELGLFGSGECIASICAWEACDVLYIPRDVVLECLETNAQAAMCMLRKVGARLDVCHRKLAELALTSVGERVAGVLLENTSEAENGAVLPFGSEQLARLVGASREMISRVVRVLIAEGVVRRQKRKLIVVNREALLQSARGSRKLTSREPVTGRLHRDKENSSLEANAP
jgi:CRP-like cAMP-binding protein